MAARSKARVCGHSLAGIAGSNPTGIVDVYVANALCFQVEVSATDRHLVQRNPIDTETEREKVCVCVCVRACACVTDCDRVQQ